MKHTIKLLTVAITLAAILTLTGCPGPVTPDKPCTHEHTRTEVIEKAAYNKDGLGKIICIDCEEVIDEQAEISRFVAGGYDGDDIPTNILNQDPYRYYYNGEDDYQISAYVYSSKEDAQKGENEKVLYFSFPNNTTDIPQIVIENSGPKININDLIQMKNGYIGKTVKYFAYEPHNFLVQIDDYEYINNRKKLKDLDDDSPVYIVIE